MDILAVEAGPTWTGTRNSESYCEGVMVTEPEPPRAMSSSSRALMMLKDSIFGEASLGKLLELSGFVGVNGMVRAWDISTAPKATLWKVSMMGLILHDGATVKASYSLVLVLQTAG